MVPSLLGWQFMQEMFPGVSVSGQSAVLRDGDGDLPHLDRGIMKVSLHNVRILPRKWSMEVSKFMDLNNFQVFFAARFHRRQ